MGTIRHSAVLLAVFALIAFAIPSLASAASTQAVPTRHLPASGATIRWTVMVRNAKTCRWGSSPEVAGFDGTVTCKPGRVVRPAKFKANTSTKAKDYTLTLTVRGKTTTVDHLKVVEAGRSVTKTTVPTTTSTTTTSTTTTSTTTTVPFECSGNVTVTGTVTVTGGPLTFVTWVRGTLTNGRNVPIYDVEVSVDLLPTNQEEMGNTVVVPISGSIARGAKVSWVGNGPSLPSPEEITNLWVSNYANDATGINCGLNGFGSN